MEGSTSRPGLLYPRERPGTHCTGGWVGPRAGLASAKNLASTGIRSPDRLARSSVAIPTELPGSIIGILESNPIRWVLSHGVLSIFIKISTCIFLAIKYSNVEEWQNKRHVTRSSYRSIKSSETKYTTEWICLWLPPLVKLTFVLHVRLRTEQDRQWAYKRNTEARSRNRCCCGKS